MNFINSYLSKIAFIEKIIVITTTLLIMIGMNLLVIMRYFLNMNLMGLDEFILLFALWAYFIGSAYGTYENSHITSDFLMDYLKDPFFKSLLNSFVQLVVLIVTAIFCYWALKHTLLLIEKRPTTLVWDIPTYYTEGAVFVGFLLMLIFKFGHLLESVLQTINLYRSKRGEKN